MAKRTALYDLHLASQAKMVDFAGWEMPLHYGSQIKEHHAVRQQAGMFDVSHMGVVDIRGDDAHLYLQRLLANNVGKLINGKALYSCMLNEQGGVVDDLIVYKIADDYYRMVINAGTKEKDLAWMKKQAGWDAKQHLDLQEQDELAILALQGPLVSSQIVAIFPQFTPIEIETIKSLKPFTFVMIQDVMVARTGYTGEDGYEVILPKATIAKLWQSALAAGIMPCGLGARDTLRLEAGLNLYGKDMDETVTPLESNLAWTVAFLPTDRVFIGREALEAQMQEGVKRCLVGLILDEPGIIRDHQRIILHGQLDGEVTSGGYSPTLEKSIALARVSQDVREHCLVEIRNKRLNARVIKPPFVRHGKKVF